jgi:putative ABC transport system permease protein
MTLIVLTPYDLALAASLVILLALLSIQLRLGIARQLLFSGLRTVVQLMLIGVILKSIFSYVHLGWITLLAIVMLLIAGREVMSRQKYRLKGWWGFGLGTLSMFISSFSITLIALNVIINVDPWYTPQYAIPLLGMMLGNTMNGISLGQDRLNQSAWQQRSIIEARLMLGWTWSQAISDIRQDSIRTGMMPIINAMAAAGIVSLPGMMTGQILAGTAPMEAVKYQILIMFLITAGTGFGTFVSVWFGSRRLFDERERLRLERLQSN